MSQTERLYWASGQIRSGREIELSVPPLDVRLNLDETRVALRRLKGLGYGLTEYSLNSAASAPGPNLTDLQGALNALRLSRTRYLYVWLLTVVVQLLD
jgi:hypothetical protein